MRSCLFAGFFSCHETCTHAGLTCTPPRHLGPDLKHTVTSHARLINQSELKWGSGRGLVAGSCLWLLWRRDKNESVIQAFLLTTWRFSEPRDGQDPPTDQLQYLPVSCSGVEDICRQKTLFTQRMRMRRARGGLTDPRCW